jgi:ferritin
MSAVTAEDVREMIRRAGVPMLKRGQAISAPDDKSITKEPPRGQKEEQTEFISQKLISMLGLQVGNEVFAAYSYYGVAAWFQNVGLDGFAKYHEAQGADEINHAKKIYKHLIDAGAPLALPKIDAPLATYDSVEQACAAIVEHEKSVTASWRAIGEQALKDKDMATLDLANWFVKEQTEEETKAITLWQRVRIAQGGSGLLTIDADLKEG